MDSHVPLFPCASRLAAFVATDPIFAVTAPEQLFLIRPIVQNSASTESAHIGKATTDFR
jgi:hypothetical protein